MKFFFIKVLKSPRSYDFLKQIELVDIVDNMKKFQELHHRSMISINEIFSDLQASAGKSRNHRSRNFFGSSKVKNKAPFNNG